MESPGEYLKREREHRGIKLSEVFNATRVPMKYLIALEADDYDSMPHPTFIKGYIKAYCKVLGVDETDAVLRFEVFQREKALKAGAGKKPEPRAPMPKRIEQPPLLGEFWSNRRNVAMVAGGAIGVIIIIIIAVFLIRGRGAPSAPVESVAHEEPAQAPPVNQAPPAPEKPAEKPAPKAAAPAKKAPAKPAAVVKKEQPQAPVELRHSLVVKANEVVWIQVSIDGKEPFDVTLKDGETVVWKAEKGLELKIGNAGGVDLTFDGKHLAPPGQPGYVVSLDLPGGEVKVLSRPKPVEEKPAPEPSPAPGAPGAASPAPAPSPAGTGSAPAAGGVKPAAKSPAPAPSFIVSPSGVAAPAPQLNDKVKELAPAPAPAPDEVKASDTKAEEPAKPLPPVEEIQ